MKLTSCSTVVNGTLLFYLARFAVPATAAGARAAATNRLSVLHRKNPIIDIELSPASNLRRDLKASKVSKVSKAPKAPKALKKGKNKKSKKSKTSQPIPAPSLSPSQVTVLPSSCFLLNEGLGDNNTAPVPSEDCGPLYDSLVTLQNDTFAREDFAFFFNQVLLQGIESFVLNGTSPDLLQNITMDFASVLVRLEEYIFDENVTLNETDFSALLAYNYSGASRRSLSSPLNLNKNSFDSGETPEAIEAYLKQHKDDAPEYSTALSGNSHNGRSLIDDDDLTPECLDVIIRIVVEVIGLLLTAIGIRGIVTRPFKEYFVQIKGGQLNGLVLRAYRQSRGEFDFGFFAGLVVSFLSILTWKDIKSALDELSNFDDWFSLCLGLLLAIGSVLLTGGLAIAAAVGSILLQGDSLRQDVEDLGQCFALCSDGYTQSGGQSTQTFVVALDRSEGELTLTYQMYRIPDQLDLIYEGNTIFTTGGLVSGSQTITRNIDGDAEEILVKITAPNSGTAWNFQLECPVPELFRM